MSQGPSVGSVVADRYRLLRILVADPPRRHWLAEDGRERRRVEIVELPLQSVVAWTGAITVEHAGLAALHATLTCHGGSFGVFEQIAGQSLAERIAAGRAFDRGTVFSTVIALADAVAHLHAAGVAHGSISAESVLFRDATAEQPLLSYRGPLPPGSPYRPPEATATVDREHDIWSLAALLFLLETRRLPPATGIYSEADLSGAGIDDELLAGVLAQGLAADPSRRSRRLKSLIHPLRVWLQRHDPRTLSRGASSLRALGLSKVEDDPHAPSIEVRRAPLSEPPPEGPSLELGGSFASEPPPRPSEAPLIEVSESMMPETEESPELLVPSTSTPPAVSPVAASRGSRRWLPIAAGLAAGAGAVFLIALGARPPQPTEKPPAPAPAPTPARSSPAGPATTTPPPPASAPPAKPGPVHRVAHETTAACVERHLPEGSFPTSPDMDFLCMTHDPREGDHLMRAALVNAAKGQAVTPAMRMWSGLTWYGMAGFAALRAGCCPDAPAIELPEPGTNCKALGPLLDALGRATVEDEDVDATLAEIRTTIGCEIENRRSVVFWRKDSPGGAEPTTLRGLLAHVRKPRPPAEK